MSTETEHSQTKKIIVEAVDSNPSAGIPALEPIELGVKSGRNIEELRSVQYKKQKDKIKRWPLVKCLICGMTFSVESGKNHDFAIVKYFCLQVGPELVGMVCDSCGYKIESGNKLQLVNAPKEAGGN